MRTIIRSIRTLLAALVLAAAAPACADHDAPVVFPEDDGTTAALTVEEATTLAQSALEALNEGDYDGFTAVWSADMRSNIGPDAFAEFRAATLARSGRFVEIVEASLTDGETEGNVRFTFLCQFEKEELLFVLAFREDGTEAVGVFLDAPTE